MVLKVTKLRIVIKGLARVEDAAAAVKVRAAAIPVSNHDGRSLDDTVAAVTVLPKILDTVQGAVRLYSTPAYAAALTLRRCSLSVPMLSRSAGRYGGSRPWVGLDYFRRELVDTTLHLGVDKIAWFGPDHLIPLDRRSADGD